MEATDSGRWGRRNWIGRKWLDCGCSAHPRPRGVKSTDFSRALLLRSGGPNLINPTLFNWSLTCLQMQAGALQLLVVSVSHLSSRPLVRDFSITLALGSSDSSWMRLERSCSEPALFGNSSLTQVGTQLSSSEDCGWRKGRHGLTFLSPTVLRCCATTQCRGQFRGFGTRVQRCDHRSQSCC